MPFISWCFCSFFWEQDAPIIDKKPWHADNKNVPEYKNMEIHISSIEVSLRSRIKAYGGKWNSNKKVWQLSYEKVKELYLLERIVDDES